MGNIIQNIKKAFDSFGTKESRIVLIGLDGAGKTTMLYQIKLGENAATVPTIGFNVEKVKFKNVEFTVWDIGGQTKIRNLWKFYFDNTDAIIYMVDSSDDERIQLAKETLEQVLSDDRLTKCPLLVFGNKMDLCKITTGQLVERLGLHSMRGRDWHLQPSCAINGSGLSEGFEWLGKTVSQKK